MRAEDMIVFSGVWMCCSFGAWLSMTEGNENEMFLLPEC